MYKIGTVKVAWTKNNDINHMESVMFDSLSDALSFVKGKSGYMIMELDKQDKDYYKWKVLPYGKYKSYKYGMVLSESPIVLIGISILAIYGVYKLVKK